ncbi:hypothetical protein FPANT_12526 [Fusarium pseudoanthophilum]|uniref:Nephrocystin 3-like N-terminal domain-containing protein n=1 Tax=Fusarium pseudoanthophilum TaxID=48495 RepID=A0A8H5KJD5_9HYPO|nr:hypothetical protein FPANT_12526 [Fusarium pseudoanthophilum]
MDPLSAFSLATGIVTFVDFGTKLLSQFSEIRLSQNGRPAVSATLEADTKNLSEKATHARNKVATLQDLYPRRFESLSRLAEDCTRAEKQLQVLLNSLTVKDDHVIKSLKSQALVSFRGIMKQGDIRSLENLLKSIHDQIMMDVIMCIPTINDMKTKIEDLEPVFHNISRGCSATMRDREIMAGGLWASIATADKVAPYASLETCVEDVPYSPHDDDAICNRILEGLKFKDMMAREGLIEDPFPETFQWLLQDQHPDDIQPPRFKQWLESAANETPFWITGNPASGKSTLMKYICTHTAIQEHLRRWSGDLGLLTYSISQVVLETISTHRLAVFIDGLDEYEGDLKSLISFVKQLHSHEIVKLCISSRPWNIFRDEFKVYPSLRMELLTRPDIEKYIHGRIKTSPAFQELRIVEPARIEKLEFEIIEKAEGVFLWVILVVEKLITVARDNNDLQAIWKEFAALQPGLEDLYASMRRRMDKSLLEGASKMYQILISWKKVQNHSMSAPDFWMAINCHDPGELQDFPANDMKATIGLALERRVAGHTGGMLQVRCNAPKATRTSVDFLHRTVFHWLRSIWPIVIRDGPTDYDPSLVLASILVSQSRRYHIGGSGAVFTSTETRDVFHFGRSCKDCIESRSNPLRIIGRIQQDELRGAILDQEYIDFEEFPLATLRSYVAIEHSCAPFLQALLESPAHSTFLEPPGMWSHMIPTSLWNKHKRQWLSLVIDAALMPASSEAVKGLNNRLKIFNILLQTDFPPRKDLKKKIGEMIKMKSWPEEYWQTLFERLQGNGLQELTHVTPHEGYRRKERRNAISH